MTKTYYRAKVGVDGTLRFIPEDTEGKYIPGAVIQGFSPSVTVAAIIKWLETEEA